MIKFDASGKVDRWWVGMHCHAIPASDLADALDVAVVTLRGIQLIEGPVGVYANAALRKIGADDAN